MLAQTAHSESPIFRPTSPVLQILAGLGEPATQAAWDDIRRQLRAFDTPTGWEGPNGLLITVAHCA